MSGKEEKEGRDYTKVYAVAEYSLGDLISAKHYNGYTLQIEGYTVESYKSIDDEFNHDTVVYDCTVVETGDMAIAEQHDVKGLICDAGQASHYIEQNIRENTAYYFETLNKTPKEEAEPVKNNTRSYEKAEIKRRKEYRAKIEPLLDEYNRLKAEGENEQAADVMSKMKVLGAIHAAGGVASDGKQ